MGVAMAPHPHGEVVGVGVAHSGVIGSLQSTATLVNCMCGAGLVALPFCFFSCGVGLALVTMLVSMLACRFSFSLLLSCRQLSNRKSYEELAEQTLGVAGRQCVRWCEAALNLGTTVAHLNILADVLSSVAGSLIPPGAEPSRQAYVTGVTILGALPVAVLVRDPRSVSALSTASVVFVFAFATACVIMALSSPSAADLSELDAWRWRGLAVAFPVFAYAFSAHSDLLGIYAEMRRPTILRMLRVTDSALSVASTLYAVVGVAGYLQWQALLPTAAHAIPGGMQSRTSGDMLRNLGAADLQGVRGAYERALKACYGLSILACIPLMVSPFYVLLLQPPEDAECGPYTEQVKSTRRAKSAKSSDGGNDDIQQVAGAEASPVMPGGEESTPLLLTVSSQGEWPGAKGQASSTLNRRAAARAEGHGVKEGTSEHAHAPPHLANTHSGDVDAPTGTSSRRPLSPVAGSTTTGNANNKGILAFLGTSKDAQPKCTGAKASESDLGARQDGNDDVHYVDPSTGKTSAALSGGAPPTAFTANRHDVATYWLFNQPTFWQHAYAVVVVLGVAILCTNWVPNVEFIMGLTGSTACLMLSYVLPPAMLLVLMASCPELSNKPVPGVVMLPDDMRRSWEWRRRGAIVLLVFGLITGVVCTAAVLGAVQEEAAVVQLAQELVGAEAVAQQTAEGRAKAQQALTTVAAVEAAAAQLNAAQIEANSTMDRLNQAAASLHRFTNRGGVEGIDGPPRPPGSEDAGGSAASGWGLNTWVEEHKQERADSKTLKGVEAQLHVAKAQVATSAGMIRDIIKQLDAAREALRQEQEAAAAVANATADAEAAGSSTGSSGTGDGPSAARLRAKKVASELSKTLQLYGAGGGGRGSGGGGRGGEGAEAAPPPPGGRPLEQVRANAVATLAALQETATVLNKVSDTIASARLASHKDVEVRREAAAAMAEALNASATSGLALTITQQVLAASASQEADELIAALTKVASDLQLARSKGGTVGARLVSSPPPPLSPPPPTDTLPLPPSSDLSTTSQAAPNVASSPASSDEGAHGMPDSGSAQHLPGDMPLPSAGPAPAPTDAAAPVASGVRPVAAPGPPATGKVGALTSDKIQALQKAVDDLDIASGGALTKGSAAVTGFFTGTPADSAHASADGMPTSVTDEAVDLPGSTEDKPSIQEDFQGSGSPARVRNARPVGIASRKGKVRISPPLNAGLASTRAATTKDTQSAAATGSDAPPVVQASAQDVLRDAVQATQVVHDSIVQQIDKAEAGL